MTSRKLAVNRENWIWMPHPAHFIGGSNCQFTLATYVGGYIVSTVGEYWPDQAVRKIHADVRGIQIEGKGDTWDSNYFKKFGWVEIGCGRTYETMVFKAVSEESICCPFRIDVKIEVDFVAYNDADSATKGHYEMCDKWSKEA